MQVNRANFIGVGASTKNKILETIFSFILLTIILIMLSFLILGGMVAQYRIPPESIDEATGNLLFEWDDFENRKDREQIRQVEQARALKDDSVRDDAEKPKNTELPKSDTGGVVFESVSEIKDLIRETAERYGVDSQKALKIAEIVKCESNFQNIPNQKYGDEGGMGIFQFIPQSWDYVMGKMGIENGDPYDIELNIEAGVYLFTTEGEKHWEKSAGCWRQEKEPCLKICPPYLLLNYNTCECQHVLEETITVE